MTEAPRILVLFGSTVLFGAERGNLEALAALKMQGAELLCLINDARWNIDVPPALDARQIPYRKVPYFHVSGGMSLSDLALRTPMKLAVANWQFLRVIGEFKPTHIHAYSQTAVANFAVGLAFTKVPMVFRAGDEPTVHNWYWRATWRNVVRRVSRFVANSKYVAATLIAGGVDPDRIDIMYNSPPSRLNLEKSPLELDVSSAARVIAYVGQIAEHKGPHLLIEAFRKISVDFPAAVLLLAGRVSDWEGDAWARALRDSTLADDSLSGRVRFLGLIEDVPGLFERCEFVVVPSLFADPSPNVVMEAKQQGRPSIVFPCGGLPELIEHGVDGIVCGEAKVEPLIEAMALYLREPELARRHGRAASSSISKLGVNKFATRWREIYDRASSQGRQNALDNRPEFGTKSPPPDQCSSFHQIDGRQGDY